jgi:hypothetical protein
MDCRRHSKLDEGLLSVPLRILVYMGNPHSHKKWQWRITARPRISAVVRAQEEAAKQHAGAQKAQRGRPKGEKSQGGPEIRKLTQQFFDRKSL